MMPATRIGQPAFIDWARSGFGAELVKLSPHDDPGPSPGKKPTESGWQTMAVTHGMVQSWALERGNVGLRTKYFPAFDIDVDDPEIAAECEKVIRGIVGDTALRTRSNSARRALLYRLEGKPFEKRVLKFQVPSGAFAKVEVLAAGQQIAVAGPHSTGVPLVWNPEQPEAARLQGVTLDGVEAALSMLRARLTGAGCAFQPERPATVERRPFRMTEWEADAELIEEALSRVNPDCEYDDWVRVGMALHAKDSGSRGFDTWDSWSARGEKYPGRDELEKKWRTFKAGEIHFGTLVAMAGVSAKKHVRAVPPPIPDAPPPDWEDPESPVAPVAAVAPASSHDRLEEMAAGHYEPAPLIPTGLVALDKALNGGIPLNKLAVIAARTSHGKTATTVRLAVNTATAGHRVIVIWCEDEEVEFDLRALAVLARTPFPAVLEAYRRKTLAAIWGRVPLRRKEAWRANCRTIRLDRPRPAQIAEYVRGEKGATFLLDHLGEVNWGDGKKHELIGDGLRLIRAAALEAKCLFIGMAQLNRDWDRRKAASENAEKVRPCLSDIENSGQIEQVARVCVIAEKVMTRQGEEEVPTGKYRYHVFKPRIATAEVIWHEDTATPDNPEPVTYGGDDE